MCMKKELYSERLNKSFELEVCSPKEGELVGDVDDVIIVRSAGLERILFNDLAGAVNWSWATLSDGGIIVEIRDDSGVHVAGVGDIAYKGLKSDIARKFPDATAWSRAISSAVVKYLGFEGRVYPDTAFELESKYDSVDDEAIKTPKTVDPLAAATTTVREKTENDFADFVWEKGKAKGMTIREILASDDANIFAYTSGGDNTRGYSYLKYVAGMSSTSKELVEKILAILKRVDNEETV